MADHRADIEDIDGVNADKLFEAMEIEFENIMDDVKVENIRNVEDMDIKSSRISETRMLETKCSK